MFGGSLGRGYAGPSVNEAKLIVVADLTADYSGEEGEGPFFVEIKDKGSGSITILDAGGNQHTFDGLREGDVLACAVQPLVVAGVMQSSTVSSFYAVRA